MEMRVVVVRKEECEHNDTLAQRDKENNGQLEFYPTKLENVSGHTKGEGWH